MHDSLPNVNIGCNESVNIASMRDPNVLDLMLPSKGMHIGHINIQGVQNKMDEIKLMLNSSKNNVHILGLSETKLKAFHPCHAFNVENYCLYRKDRVLNDRRKEEGGGIIVYVKNSIKCKRRSDLECDDIECMFLEVFPNKSKSFIIGNIYRHPNENIYWNEKFEILLENVLSNEKELYLLGDFNRDLLKEQTKKTWLEYMEHFGLYQQIIQPTRQTENSSTLIDHIYCNMPANISSIKIPKLGLSDHFPIFFTRKLNFSQTKSSHHTISYRSFKGFNETEFTYDLKNAPWNVIKVFENTDDILDTWTSMYLEIVDKHLPLRKHRVRHKQQPKWLTPDIIDAMKTRDQYRSLNNEVQYKIWRNKVLKLIKKSKKEQYRALIEENNNKPGSVWKIFKELGATKRNSQNNINSIIIDGQEISDSDNIATVFNKFFVSVAASLQEPVINPDFDRLKSFCNSKISNDTTFTIPPVTFSMVEQLLRTLDTNKATGSDNLGPRLLKISAPYIAESITYIYNESITSSVFPQKWKEAKVTPLFKNGVKDDVNNYRPISVLPVLSKILEKHVHDALMGYLNANSLLHATQSGFRPNHSCETALVGMIDKWLNANDKGSQTGVVMIDFKKAFDLVDHSLLIKKLQHFKFSGNTLNWFSSYLLDRKQKVSVNTALSQHETILNGVPQGSILGPLLFLLFINDLPLYTGNVFTDLYADDTTLYCTGNSLAFIQHKLQVALDNLEKWCKSNGMVINISKTKIMLITTKQKRAHLDNDLLHLTYNSAVLSNTSCDKILGVHIDNNLTWSTHIENISKKITSNIWLLSRIKDYLTEKHRVQFYKSYIQPHIDYCNIIWGSTHQSNLDRLYKLQKRACRIIKNYSEQNICQSMKELKIQNVYERVFLRKAKFMYKVANSITPSYINDMFQPRADVEDVPFLRSVASTNFIPPRPNRELFKQSMTYSGTLIWNSIPVAVKNSGTIDSFHRSCIKWMNSTQDV